MYLNEPKQHGDRMRVRIRETGMDPEQNLDRKSFVLKGLSEGWVSLSDDEKTLTVHGVDADGKVEDLVYEVLRTPGYYCRATGDRIPLSKFAEDEAFNSSSAPLAAAEARKWLEAHSQPLYIKLPFSARDPRMVDVANYEAPKHYACRLNAAQHEKWRAVQNKVNWIAAHLLAKKQADAATKKEA
jgi:hypothetical protein